MAQCTQCGKEASILFDHEDQHLCWLCSSRLRATSMTVEETRKEEEYQERRAWYRYPVQIHMKFFYGQSEKSKIIFPGTTVNISAGGLCIEWTPCETCSGYAPGAIDSNCVFSRYDISRSDSELLYLSLFLSEDDVINFTAKVVFVIKREDGTEYIGLSFVDLDDYTRGCLNDIIKAVTV